MSAVASAGITLVLSEPWSRVSVIVLRRSAFRVGSLRSHARGRRPCTSCRARPPIALKDALRNSAPASSFPGGLVVGRSGVPKTRGATGAGKPGARDSARRALHSRWHLVRRGLCIAELGRYPAWHPNEACAVS